MGTNQHSILSGRNRKSCTGELVEQLRCRYIQAEDIINLIVIASKTNVTNKIVTLKGPPWKASPPVKELISENKRAFYNWKQIGRPKDENSIEYIEMERCKTIKKPN
jgi:hypothetical protein